MRAVIQRVKSSTVKSEGKILGSISAGYLVLLAIQINDQEIMLEKMADKIINLRICGDNNGKMNLSLKETNGQLMIVSQFTLYGDCNNGNRPSFIKSARPEKAEPFYLKLIEIFCQKGIKVAAGKFGAYMEVELVNDGPTTVIIDL